MANHLILGKSAGYSIGGVKMRISEDARRSVVFFGIEGPEGIEYGGTGFLIQWIEGDLRWPYLVTARHVAEGLSKHETFFIRANLLNGDAISVEIEHASWVFPEDESVDLAVVPYGLNVEAMDHVHIPMPEFLANFDDPLAIACGDAINIVGLFRLHRGNKRAIPFVHCGWVSVLPDSNERVPIRNPATGKLFGSEAFLVEVNRPGIAGGSNS